MSKKFLLEKDTLPYWILVGLTEYYFTINQLVMTLKHSKQNINYWLSKLAKEGLVTRVEHGIYDITEEGNKLLNTCDQEKSKEMVRLENMRYKFPIHEGLGNLVKARWLKVNDGMNNIKSYHGKFEGFTVAVYAGSESPILQITCQKRYGVDIYEMMYYARSDVEEIGKWIAKDYGLKLGMCEPAMEPEWAIPSPLAKIILEKTCSSQIRTTNGVINRSKGRNADLETRDIRLANDIFMMPQKINKIESGLTELKNIISGIRPNQSFTVSNMVLNYPSWINGLN